MRGLISIIVSLGLAACNSLESNSTACPSSNMNAQYTAGIHRNESLGRPNMFFADSAVVIYLLVNPNYENRGYPPCNERIQFRRATYDSLMRIPFFDQFFRTGRNPRYRFLEYVYESGGKLFAQEYRDTSYSENQCSIERDTLITYGPFSAQHLSCLTDAGALINIWTSVPFGG